MHPLPLLCRTSKLIFLLSLLLAVVVLSSCSGMKSLSRGGTEIALVPLTEQPTDTYLPGKVIWHDLLSPDLKSSGTFYQELFGWQIEYKSYSALVRNNGELIASIIKVEPQKGKMKSVWMPSISVLDIEKTADQVLEKGGTLIKGPLDMGKRGRVLLIEDVQGSHLVLVHTPGGDPMDREAELGDWLWDEIWSDEPETVGDFYTSIFGYDVTHSVSRDYTVLEMGGKWRAGIRHVDNSVDNLLWVPIVRVTDPVETAKRAEQLGGQVLLSTEQVKNKGNVALLRDSAGAFLLIQRWMPELAKGGN